MVLSLSMLCFRSLLILSTLLISPAYAEALIGVVVGVSDGDTITVLDAERQQHKVRLGGIDAPEKAQPFRPTLEGKPVPTCVQEGSRRRLD